MSPFDAAARAEAEAVFQRHLAAVSARMQPRPRAPLMGPPPPTATKKRQVWAAAPVGKRGTPFPALDYAAWAAELVAFMSQSHSYAEIGDLFGLSEDGVGKRLTRARKEGHWPPKGMRQQWVRAGRSYRLALVPA